MCSISSAHCTIDISKYFCFCGYFYPGYGQRFMQLFTLSEKHPTFNLKAEIKKLIFISGEPLVVCENSVTFANVMSTFTQHEKSVSRAHTIPDWKCKKIDHISAGTAW